MLVEPQRTNLLTYSSSFDNGAWSKTAISVSANSATAPNGLNTADTLSNTSASAIILQTSPSVNTSAVVTFSAYLKRTNNDWVVVAIARNGATTYGELYVWFNIATGAVGSNLPDGAAVLVDADIEDAGNGWYRCSVTGYVPNAVSYVAFMFLPDANSSFNRVTSQSVYAWGAQLEAGSYPTSYIPTTSASVTRNADVISKTGISSLIGQTEGVIYSEFTCDFKNPSGAIPIYLRGSGGGGTYSYSTYVQMGASNFNVLVFSNGVAQLSLNSGTLTEGQMVKMAFAYKANDFVLYINGVQTSFYNAGTPSIGLNAIDFGTYFSAPSTFQYDGFFKAAALWKTRLTNTQLAQLTTI